MQTKEQRERMIDKCNDLYAKIDGFINQFGYPPTIREMVDLTGLSSTSVVKSYLITMRNWGWVTFEENKARTVRLLRPADGVSPKAWLRRKNRIREQIRPIAQGKGVTAK